VKRTKEKNKERKEKRRKEQEKKIKKNKNKEQRKEERTKEERTKKERKMSLWFKNNKISDINYFKKDNKIINKEMKILIPKSYQTNGKPILGTGSFGEVIKIQEPFLYSYENNNNNHNNNSYNERENQINKGGYNNQSSEIKYVAVKTIKSQIARQQPHYCLYLYRELYMLRNMKHPNIITLKDVKAPKYDQNNLQQYEEGGLDGSLDILQLVFECADCDLAKYLHSRRRGKQNLSDYECQHILYQLALATKYIHSANIIHRDIKPENICLDLNGKPYLTDFGISEMVENNHKYSKYETILPISSSSSGTLLYLAPEILARGNHHSYQVDFWSLGVVMYELLFRKRPYEKMAPYPMIIYSHETYQTLWLSMLSQPDILPSPTEFDSDSTTSLIHVDQPQISSLYQVKQKFCKINDTPLNNNLIFDIPKTTSIGDLISLECHNMLLSLLDVRIQKRLGAHERYSDFIDHNWFANVSIPTSSLEKYQSPININLDYVGEYIWEKYSKLDLISSIEHFAESQVQLPEHEKIDFSHFELPYVAPI